MTDRPSRVKRWTWILGVLGVLGVLLVQFAGALLRAEWTEQQVARAVEAAIEQLSGERVVVGDLEIMPSRARVEVDGLVLTHLSDDPDQDGVTVLAVDHIGVQFQPFKRGTWVGEVVVEQPVLRLNVDEDGLREFRDAASGGSTSFPWTELTLRDGKIVVALPDGHLKADGVNISTVPEYRDRYDVRLDSLGWTHGGMEQLAQDVHFPMVQAGPNRVVLPELDLQTEALSMTGDLGAVAGGPVGGNVSVSFELPALDAVVTPPTRFEGEVHLDIDLSGTTEAPKVEGAMLLSDLVVHHQNHHGRAVRYEVPEARFGWRMVEDGVALEDGRISWASGELRVDGLYQPETTGVSATVSLEGVSLSDAIRQSSGPADAWTTFTGDGEIDVAGTLQPLNLSGGFDMALVDLWVHNGPVRGGSERLLDFPKLRMRGDLTVESDGIRVHARDMVAGATRGEVDAWLGFNWFGPLDVKLEMDRVSLSSFRPLKGLDLRGQGRIYGRIHGPYDNIQYDASTRFSNFSVMGFAVADEIKANFECADRRTLEFTDIEAVLGQTMYQGAYSFDTRAPSMDVALEITQGRIADLLGIVGADMGVLDGDMKGSVALSGPPASLDGDVALRLQSVDLLGERFAGGELYSWMDDGRATIEGMSLSRWNGEEGVLVRGTIGEGWATNLDVIASGFRVRRLDALQRWDLPVQGQLSIDARLGGTLMSPEPSGRVAIRESWFAGHSVPDSTIFFDTLGGVMQLEGHLLGQGMSFDGHIEMTPTAKYRGSAKFDRFPLHTVLPAAVDGSPVNAWLSGRVTSSGEIGGAQRFARVQAQGTGLDIHWGRHHLEEIAPWRFTLDGREMAMRGFGLKGVGTRLTLDAETGADGRIYWDGGGRFDLDLARMAVPGLERADGGGYLRVATSDPQTGLTVDLAACDATIQGDWFPHPVEGFHGVIRGTRAGYAVGVLEPEGRDAQWWRRSRGLRACGMRLPSEPALLADIGGGRAEVQGRIQASRWVPTNFDLSGTLQDGTVAYFDFLPAAVGDVELSFDGDVGQDLLLSGDISIKEMMFSQRIEWEDWLLELSDEWLDSAVTADEDPLFAMDLKIEADQTVRMRNNVADLTASGSLRVVGDTARPGMTGSIRAEPGGRIHLKEREFELERGELRFVDPLAYDPALDIVLRTDVRTREQTYDVEYRVLGTYEDWRAETSSQPGLSSADINALLLFGMTRDELERYGGLGGILAVEGSDLLASKMFLSGGAGSERGGLFRIVDPLRPDRLDLVSGVSERGSGILSSDLRLLYENELDDIQLPGTLMIFEQNLTTVSDTYLGLEQRLARTLFARTYWASEQHGRHLDIGGAYGLEMKVRWELD